MSGKVSPNSRARSVRKMDSSASGTATKSSFYCGVESHLTKHSRVCALIYLLASRVSAKRGGLFWPSATKIASHLRCSKDAVYRAIRALRELGLFELLRKTPYGTNIHRVLSHDEWAKKHPGQCVLYQSDSEGDRTEPSSETVLSREAETGATHEYVSGDQKTRTKSQDSMVEANANPDGALPLTSADTGRRSVKEQCVRNTVSESAVRSLVRDLTYLSDEKVTFQRRHNAVLDDLLKEYSAEELKGAFDTFLEEKDLDDPYTMKFIAQNYLDAADGLAYSARKRKQEVDQEKKDREAAVARLQAEAEADRLAIEEKQKEEAELFDPLAV